jgi:DNA repair exonuclease SbcCD ATPase subunit
MHNGQDYRITKQFLDSPIALLERRENGHYRRLAEGAAADEQTREILTKNPPGRGLARLDNWGLAQILWASQGNLAISSLSGDVIDNIRHMLCAQISSTFTGPIEKRIEDLYLQYYTAKGKLKTGKDAPRVIHLKEQLTEAYHAKQETYDQYLAFEGAARRVEDLRSRRAQARHEVEEISRALRNARIAAEGYRKLAVERDKTSERVRSAEAQYGELRQRIDLIKGIEKDLDDSNNKLQSLEKDIPLKDKELQDREKDTARLKAALEDVRKGREDVDALGQLADRARRFNECRKELQEMDGLISNIRKSEKALNHSWQRRNKLVAPDSKTLKSIQRHVKDRDDAQVRIDASLITLEVVPYKDGVIDVITGETKGSLPAKAGVPAQVKGSPEVVADLHQIARIRAWGPSDSVETHRTLKAKSEQKLRELTEPFGTLNIEELELLTEKAKNLDRSIAEADIKLQTLLSGRSSDEVQQERNALEIRYQCFLETQPDWENTPPDVEALEAQARDKKDSFDSRVKQCEFEWERAQNALSAVAAQKDTLTQRIDDAKKKVKSLVDKRDEIVSDNKPLKEMENDLQQISMKWDAARGRFKEIEDQLHEYGDNPVELVERLENNLESVGQESDKAREEEIREEARLENLSAQGPYSRMVQAEEHVSQLEEEIKHEELRIEAIRLLHETVAKCKADTIAAVSKPVEDKASRTLQRIAGRRLRRIAIGDAFIPTAVMPGSIEEPVDLDSLSGGEQEQLYLATRLALAEILGKDERQMVVLDDVLTATDAGRLARVMGVLEDAAQQLQILILTCHPERYRTLKNTQFFDLEALMRGAACEKVAL